MYTFTTITADAIIGRLWTKPCESASVGEAGPVTAASSICADSTRRFVACMYIHSEGGTCTFLYQVAAASNMHVWLHYHNFRQRTNRNVNGVNDAMRCDAMRCDAMRCDAMRCDAGIVVDLPDTCTHACVRCVYTHTFMRRSPPHYASARHALFGLRTSLFLSYIYIRHIYTRSVIYKRASLYLGS